MIFISAHYADDEFPSEHSRRGRSGVLDVDPHSACFTLMRNHNPENRIIEYTTGAARSCTNSSTKCKTLSHKQLKKYLRYYVSLSTSHQKPICRKYNARNSLPTRIAEAFDYYSKSRTITAFLSNLYLKSPSRDFAVVCTSARVICGRYDLPFKTARK